MTPSNYGMAKAVGHIQLQKCHQILCCIEYCRTNSFDFYLDEYQLKVYLFDRKAFIDVANFISKLFDHAVIVNTG